LTLYPTAGAGKRPQKQGHEEGNEAATPFQAQAVVQGLRRHGNCNVLRLNFLGNGRTRGQLLRCGVSPHGREKFLHKYRVPGVQFHTRYAVAPRRSVKIICRSSGKASPWHGWAEMYKSWAKWEAANHRAGTAKPSERAVRPAENFQAQGIGQQQPAIG
jgi:hypothetical protein